MMILNEQGHPAQQLSPGDGLRVAFKPKAGFHYRAPDAPDAGWVQTKSYYLYFPQVTADDPSEFEYQLEHTGR